VDPLLVELPFTPEGATEPLAITADSPETAAALQQLSEDAVFGRQSRELIDQANRQLDEVQALRDYAQVDMEGFITDMVGDDLQAAKRLTRFLLAQPTLLNEMKPQIEKLLRDPNELRALAGDVATERAKANREATQQLETTRAVRQNLQEVQATVISMLPADMPEAARKLAFADMLHDIKRYADANSLLTLPVHQIPAILADRLTALGINPEVAASAAAAALVRRGGASMTGRPALPAVRRPAPPAPKAPAAVVSAAAPKPKQPGTAFAKAATARAGAAMPGPGAGSPGTAQPLTAPTNPDGTPMNTEQRIAWHRQRVAAGQKTY
ncbi:MAG TPA: hypothetical protein VJ247_07860, partial [Gaiella sp.]|nr:hypothetical protein [Gaiella sp.]